MLPQRVSGRQGRCDRLGIGVQPVDLPQQELAAFAVHQDMRPLDDNDVAPAWLAEQVKVDQRRGIQVSGRGKQLFGEMGDRSGVLVEIADRERARRPIGPFPAKAPAESRPHEPSGRDGVNPTESLDRRPECRLVDPPGEVNVTLQKEPRSRRRRSDACNAGHDLIHEVQRFTLGS